MGTQDCAVVNGTRFFVACRIWRRQCNQSTGGETKVNTHRRAWNLRCFYRALLVFAGAVSLSQMAAAAPISDWLRFTKQDGTSALKASDDNKQVLPVLLSEGPGFESAAGVRTFASLFRYDNLDTDASPVFGRAFLFEPGDDDRSTPSDVIELRVSRDPAAFEFVTVTVTMWSDPATDRFSGFGSPRRTLFAEQGAEIEITAALFDFTTAGSTHPIMNTPGGPYPFRVFVLSDSDPSPPVPEPETYAMMLAGLGLLGFMARRRKNLSA